MSTETDQNRTARPKRLYRVGNKTPEGCFLKHCEQQFVAQLGGLPSFAQLVLVRRAARAALQLEKLDAKMASGNWTDHDARTYGGLSNNLRLTIRELEKGRGKAAEKAVPTIAEIAARHAKAAEGASA
jgi:hypothetical protein